MSTFSNAKGLKLVFWNAQSQIHKQHYINNILLNNNIDILVITESWLREDVENKFVSSKNYIISRQDRATLNHYNITKRGGGICIYVHDSIPFSQVDIPGYNINNANLEMHTLKLNLKNLRPIFITAIYRPPAGLIEAFNNHMVDLLEDMSQTRKYDVFVGGDFNIDYTKCSPNRKVLKDLEYRFGLSQLITERTRPLYSDSIIDLIYTNNPDVSKSGTLNYNISDHLPTYVIRKKIKIKPTTSEFSGRTYQNYSREILRAKLQDVVWDEVYDEHDPNLAWDAFVCILLPVLDNICPIRKSRYTNSRPPQGSILGPLLFSLYINSLPNIVNGNMILYADDSVLFASANSLKLAHQTVQNDLIKVNVWCKYHKLTININKTKSMCFSLKVPINLNDFNIKLAADRIEYVSVYKYLGIQVDSSLTFNCQFNETYKLASY